MRRLLLLFALLSAAPVWAQSVEDALCQRPATTVDHMESAEKFCRSFARAMRQLPQSTVNEASALLSPESFALMVGLTAAWAGTQGIPVVGQAIDSAVLALGIVLITAQSASLADSLWRYADGTSTARSFAELDAAATHLSRAIATVGVSVVAFILTRRALGPGGSSGSRGPPRELATATAPAMASAVPQVSRPAALTPALAMAGNPRPPSPPRTSRGQVPKAVDRAAFAQWLQRARRRPARTAPAAYRYQSQQAGPEEFLVEGGGEQIWADGVRMDKAHLVETKFIDTPEKSPFIAESKCNEAIRRWIHQEVIDEFRRYAAIIAAPETPVVALEVVTNDARAVPFFESLLRSLGIPGEVVVR